jgi:hypothetical protein
MTTLPQLRVLHISDLHFGKNHICTPEDTTGAARGIPLLKELLPTGSGEPGLAEFRLGDSDSRPTANAPTDRCDG